MWNFFTPRGALASSAVEEDSEQDEVEEMRLKLEALRMADYREQQRLCVAREKAMFTAADDCDAAAAEAAAAKETEHFAIVDDEVSPEKSNDEIDLDDMYDALSSFRARDEQHAADLATKATVSSSSSSSSSAPPLQPARSEQQQPLQVRSKPVPAIGIQQALPTQANDVALTSVPKEKPDTVISGQKTATNLEQVNQQQQPQEPPEPIQDPLEGMNKEHVMQLAQITGELTDALDEMRAREESARAREESVRQDLRRLLQELSDERARHKSCQQALEAARAELKAVETHQEHGSAQLTIALEEKEQLLARETARRQELQERLTRKELEEAMGQALVKKNLKFQFRHLEV